MSRTTVVPFVLRCELQRIMQCSLVGVFAHTHGRAAQFGYLGSHTQFALGVEYWRCTVATFIYLYLVLYCCQSAHLQAHAPTIPHH